MFFLVLSNPYSDKSCSNRSEDQCGKSANWFQYGQQDYGNHIALKNASDKSSLQTLEILKIIW